MVNHVGNNTHIQLTVKPWKESFGGGQMVSGIDVPDMFFQKFGFGGIDSNSKGITLYGSLRCSECSYSKIDISPLILYDISDKHC